MRPDAIGRLPLPAALPVITLSPEHHVDALIRPYLPRVARGALIAWPNAARAAPGELAGVGVPLMLDSGGFLSLDRAARVEPDGWGTWDLVIESETGEERLSNRALLDYAHRESSIDVVFALDFAIVATDDDATVAQRQQATLDNAAWMAVNCRRPSLSVFGVAHGRDAAEYARHATALVASGVAGIGIGGLVPRSSRPDEIRAISASVRAAVGDALPVHAFGVGAVDLLRDMMQARTIDSADASTYARAAASLSDGTPTERLACALDGLLAFTGAAAPLARRALP
jgi:queuine/archaeosine tRNA-ribosyltransferase